MKQKTVIGGFATLLLVSVACATMAFNQIIVAIFGTGNPDDGWTTNSGSDITPAISASTVEGPTVALRAKNREDASTANASGVYLEPAGLQAPNNNRARWNFEFSIDSGGQFLSENFDYYLGIDMDHSTGVNFTVVNALTFFGDNSYGTSLTLNSQGVEGPASSLASTSTIAQQSQNVVFYGLTTGNATWDYELYVVAKGAGANGARVTTTAITVVVGAGGPPPPDADSDGVPDGIDQCPGTISGHAVDTHGCSVQDLIDRCAVEHSANHGEYVSCVVELAKKLFNQGRITKAEKNYIVKSAAQSDIGK